MGVLKLDDLHPDGVGVVVDWDVMRVGSSAFIPCINTTAAKRQIGQVFARRGWSARFYIGPEGDVWGVRVWRVA